METKMSILFYGVKSKKTSDEKVPLYLRITIDGRRFDVATNMCVESSKWSAGAAKVTGSSEDTRIINAHLDFLKRKAYDYR